MTDAAQTGAPLNGAQPGNRYLNRTLLILIVVSTLSFGLFNLVQGFDFAAYPLITHVHAVSMTVWLILLATQSILGSRGSLWLHRRLGWAGVGLAAFAVITGIATSFQTIALGRIPLVFDAGYFLILGIANMTMFALFVGGAVATRRNTSWHRRFMLGSILVIFEPVLGRLLPFFVVPAIGGPENLLPFLEQHRDGFELFRIGVHLAIILAVMLGDRAVTRRFHPVYGLMLIGVVALYALANFVGGTALVEAYAAGLNGSGG